MKKTAEPCERCFVSVLADDSENLKILKLSVNLKTFGRKWKAKANNTFSDDKK